MKRLKNAIAAAGLLATATMAQAAEVATTTAPAMGANELGGGSTLLWIAIAVALGVGLFLVIDDNNKPDSP
ncbi:hypothetical protein [Novosphingobium sp. Gsoil 351]|uniref:hypothetical protein n=1 Tax=Novosphingobium sp. Gsoil 351 TaxID=2675225 RepID=UPI0012B4D721|nr:hypothetical protein [Novosphingobium sp. Gsoil 351]QGN55706.1 hypothetical protein GKE62_15275 [Novosphingobium sp. Gsoil 351]